MGRSCRTNPDSGSQDRKTRETNPGLGPREHESRGTNPAVGSQTTRNRANERTQRHCHTRSNLMKRTRVRADWGEYSQCAEKTTRASGIQNATNEPRFALRCIQNATNEPRLGRRLDKRCGKYRVGGLTCRGPFNQFPVSSARLWPGGHYDRNSSRRPLAPRRREYELRIGTHACSPRMIHNGNRRSRRATGPRHPIVRTQRPPPGSSSARSSWDSCEKWNARP